MDVWSEREEGGKDDSRFSANCVVDGSTNFMAKESWRKSKFEDHKRYLEFSFGCIEFEILVRLKEKLQMSVGNMDLELRI